MPEHAIIRDHTHHQAFTCLCGERPNTSNPDEARKVLARHILERQAA